MRDHPRRALLQQGYNGGSYIARYGDIAHFNDAPFHAFVHFLEFGCEEGRNAGPGLLDRAFVSALYGKEAAQLAPGLLIERLTTASGVPFARHVYLNASELLAAHGLRARELPLLFDPSFYRPTYLSSECANWTAAECLEHFARVGHHAGCALSEGLQVDPNFYRREYDPDVSGFAWFNERIADPHFASQPPGGEVAELTRHVLTVGLVNGLQPNLRVFVRERYGIQLSSEIERRLMALASSNPAGLRPSEVAVRFLDEPLALLAELDLSDPLSAPALWAVAARLKDREGEQQWLRARIAELFPSLPSSIHFRAQRLWRSALPADAAMAFHDALATGECDPLVRLDLAESYFASGDLVAGLGALAEGRRLPNQSPPATRALGARLARAVDDLWSSRHTLAAVRGVAATQDLIAQAARSVAVGRETVRLQGRVRAVAIVGDHSIPQCTRYRITQKAEQLRAAGYTVRAFDGQWEVEAFKSAIPEFDAVIFYRVPALPHITDAILTAGEFGLATFYETDDLIFDRAHFPPPFETYGGRITAAQHADIACGVPLFEAAMVLCDFGIASTTTLQQMMKRHVRTGRVFLHRNALGREHRNAMAAHDAKADEARLAREMVDEVAVAEVASEEADGDELLIARAVTDGPRKDGTSTIVYGSGTKAHKLDFQRLLEPALLEVAQRFGPAVRILIIGDLAVSEALATHPSVELVNRMLSYAEFLDVIARADVNLSVLEPSLPADAKSEIKWLEAAMFAVPSVGFSDGHAPAR